MIACGALHSCRIMSRLENTLSRLKSAHMAPVLVYLLYRAFPPRLQRSRFTSTALAMRCMTYQQQSAHAHYEVRCSQLAAILLRPSKKAQGTRAPRSALRPPAIDAAYPQRLAAHPRLDNSGGDSHYRHTETSDCHRNIHNRPQRLYHCRVPANDGVIEVRHFLCLNS